MLKAAISQIKLPQDRGSLLSIAKAAVTLLSLGTAHYVGFLIHIPFEILSIVSIKFLPQFVATCSFYLTLCYLTARIFSFGISQLYYSASAPLAGFSIAASKWLPKRLKNGARRIHRETRPTEKIIYWAAFLFILPFLLNFSYLKFENEEIGGLTKTLFFSILAAIIFKSGILIRGPKQIRRIVDKQRIALRKLLFRDYTYLLAGIGLAVCFYTGMLRYDKILGEDKVFLRMGEYSGNAHMLLSTDDAHLVLEDDDTSRTYVYLADGLMVKLQRAVNKKSLPTEK
ncbi:hypothetical protein [Pseudomonas baltica]|uniref:hypothetical protein n=1 Tax=Pseudomonas baltica TaxID=2762576 RepID=UPI00289681BF|nr:hypothetical protein [Pseudomonas baltica]